MGSWKENLYKSLDITSFERALHALLDTSGFLIFKVIMLFQLKPIFHVRAFEDILIEKEVEYLPNGVATAHNNACLEKIGNTS